MALVAKIRIGMYRGSISKDNSIPEFFMPTTREAPIEPIRLRHGVAIIKVNTKTTMLLESRNNAIPRNGDKIIIGSPDKIQ